MVGEERYILHVHERVKAGKNLGRGMGLCRSHLREAGLVLLRGLHYLADCGLTLRWEQPGVGRLMNVLEHKNHVVPNLVRLEGFAVRVRDHAHLHDSLDQM